MPQAHGMREPAGITAIHHGVTKDSACHAWTAHLPVSALPFQPEWESNQTASLERP